MRKIKTQFVKKGAAAGSFLHTLVDNLPFEMNLPGHNCTGPDTKLYQRLNSDETRKEWSKPIDRVDNAAYHDLCYSKHDTKTRNEVCHQTMLDELSGIVNPTLRERIDKAIVERLINTKVNFGLGASIKAKKILTFTDELAEELYKPVTRICQRRRVNVNGIDEISTADLIASIFKR